MDPKLASMVATLITILSYTFIDPKVTSRVAINNSIVLYFQMDPKLASMVATLITILSYTFIDPKVTSRVAILITVLSCTFRGIPN